VSYQYPLAYLIIKKNLSTCWGDSKKIVLSYKNATWRGGLPHGALGCSSPPWCSLTHTLTPAGSHLALAHSHRRRHQPFSAFLSRVFCFWFEAVWEPESSQLFSRFRRVRFAARSPHVARSIIILIQAGSGGLSTSRAQSYI